MALTLESVSAELQTAESMDEVCHAVSRGSLMGARGNSGVITSQILRGSGRGLPRSRRGDAPPTCAPGCAGAPTPRTRPSCGRSRARSSPSCGRSAEAVEALERRAHPDRAARRAPTTRRVASVERTPELLPVLRDAGVVDAGGKGFTLLLAALLEVVSGDAIPEPEVVNAPAVVTAHLAGDDCRACATRSCISSRRPDDTMPAFRDTWGAIGDSIVVVGGDGLWNCHIHTNDIGGAVEAGIDAGRPRKIRITDLIEQVEEERWVREADVHGRPRRVRGADRRHDRGRRGRGRRGNSPAADEPRRATGRRRRAVDEPVDRADPRSGRARAGPIRSSCCRTTRTSWRSPSRSTR